MAVRSASRCSVCPRRRGWPSAAALKPTGAEAEPGNQRGRCLACAAARTLHRGLLSGLPGWAAAAHSGWRWPAGDSTTGCFHHNGLRMMRAASRRPLGSPTAATAVGTCPWRSLVTEPSALQVHSGPCTVVKRERPPCHTQPSRRSQHARETPQRCRRWSARWSSDWPAMNG